MHPYRRVVPIRSVECQTKGKDRGLFCSHPLLAYE